MPSNRAQLLKRQTEALNRADTDAVAAMRDAEDELFKLEDRERRRQPASRASLSSRYPALGGQS